MGKVATTIDRPAKDIHRSTAAAVFEKDPELITDEERRAGKAVNYAVAYGAGESGVRAAASVLRETRSSLVQSSAADKAVEKIINHPTVDVIFRAERSGKDKGEVTAVFPSLLADHTGMMTCYVKVGGHSSCSLEWYRSTRVARENEYEDLLAVLKMIYEENDPKITLRVVKRITWRHRAERDRQLDEYRAAMRDEPAGRPWVPEKNLESEVGT